MLIRRNKERGFANHGWLQSYHSFSFASYFDRNFMGFGDLRVINDDLIAGNSGFELHPHANMEIITFVISGAITHGDNLGNREKIAAGHFQVMSAGSGIIHSEFNHENEACRLLQIWIKPKILGGEPYYHIFSPDISGRFSLISSSDGRESSIKIRQDAEIWAIDSQKIEQIDLPQTNKKRFWFQMAEGEIEFCGEKLYEGDALGITAEDEKILARFGRKIIFSKPSKILLFCLS